MARLTIHSCEPVEVREWQPRVTESHDGSGVIGHVVLAAIYLLVGAVIGSQLVMDRSAPVPVAAIENDYLDPGTGAP